MSIEPMRSTKRIAPAAPIAMAPSKSFRFKSCDAASVAASLSKLSDRLIPHWYMLAVARLDGFASQTDDGRVDEIEDRVESLRLKLQSRRDSRRVVAKRSAQPRLTVHGPAGTHIELSMKQAVDVLRALSCSD